MSLDVDAVRAALDEAMVGVEEWLSERVAQLDRDHPNWREAMRAKVLKPFPHAADGVEVRHLEVGEIVDVRDEIADGLKAGGFIEETDDDTTHPVRSLQRRWDAYSDADLKAIIRAGTGQEVEPGRMAHADLVAMAEAASRAKPRPRRVTDAERRPAENLVGLQPALTAAPAEPAAVTDGSAEGPR